MSDPEKGTGGASAPPTGARKTTLPPSGSSIVDVSHPTAASERIPRRRRLRCRLPSRLRPLRLPRVHARLSQPSPAPSWPCQRELPTTIRKVSPVEPTFGTLLISLSTQALMYLGEIPELEGGATRISGQRETSSICSAFSSARPPAIWTPDESALLERILYDLRMRFVAISRWLSRDLPRSSRYPSNAQRVEGHRPTSGRLRRRRRGRAQPWSGTSASRRHRAGEGLSAQPARAGWASPAAATDGACVTCTLPDFTGLAGA